MSGIMTMVRSCMRWLSGYETEAGETKLDYLYLDSLVWLLELEEVSYLYKNS